MLSDGASNYCGRKGGVREDDREDIVLVDLQVGVHISSVEKVGLAHVHCG